MSGDDDEPGYFGNGIQSLFSETFGMIEESLFDVGSRSLRPLFTLDIKEDMVTATFDLPGASQDDIAITCTEDSISVDAEMTRPVKLRVSSGRHQREEFVRYSKKIVLPVRVDPEKGSAKFRNGIAVVKLPRLLGGKPVRIDADSSSRRLRK